MNIAIIGCGYVGYAAANFWQQQMTHIVTATTTTPAKTSQLQTVAQRVVVLTGDDVDGIKSVLKNQDIVLLSIAAGRGGNYEKTYLETAKNIVSIVSQCPHLKQIIYTSSCSVYGEQNGRLVTEDTPLSPMSQSAEILSQTEQVLLTGANPHLHVCILRLGGIYGPNRELVKIYGRVAGQNRPGNGNEPANWIHLDDIISGIEFAKNHHLQGIYNLVDDANLTSKEIIHQVCTVHNLPPVTWDASQKSQRMYHAKISNQKLKDAGYQLTHPQMIFS
ncbi:SDR family oxidoreductase [Calothrix sp. 336/3]|uniref:SDR family oxidoreductase n=1 Tax=Calothrix sp. 336/3 TaxID=1337936 RepID=UPI0004E4139F|nr:SDR family oxidoreductase [Calothrix sp. 336/3]AKG20010.1 epimerase [Calothrix sp. 336/3]